MYRFSLLDLQLFEVLVEEQNLTKAAEKVFLAPSSASARLKHLEEQLGVTLFVRQARGLELTAAGKLVQETFRDTLRQMRHLAVALTPYTQQKQGVIRVVANYGAAIDYLPSDIAAFMQKHPQVRVHLEQMPSPQVLEAVLEGKADFGFAVISSTPTNIESRPYHDDRLVVVVPQNHPLAHSSSVAFPSTLNYPFIALTGGSAMQQFIFDHAKAYGRAIEPRIQVDNQSILLDLIAKGVGIGIVSQSAFSHHSNPNLVALNIEDEWADRPLRMLWHKKSFPHEDFLAFQKFLCSKKTSFKP